MNHYIASRTLFSKYKILFRKISRSHVNKSNRAGADQPDPEDWLNYTMAAHTSPIYINVNDQPSANAEDAKNLLAIDSFNKARDYYQSSLTRANK
jgi:hypothetical protein